VGAEAAALTGYRVNPEVFDSIEATKFLAQPALGASFFIYAGYLPTPELALLSL
jgi:hypothetical protein